MLVPGLILCSGNRLAGFPGPVGAESARAGGFAEPYCALHQGRSAGQRESAGLCVWVNDGLAQRKFGAVLLAAEDIHWSEIKGTGRFAKGPAVFRGVMLAMPPVLVFGALFASADAAFDQLVRSIIRINLDETSSTGGSSSRSAGWSRAGLATWSTRPPANPASNMDSPFGIGMVEMGIVLGALDLLFLVFVVIQVGYLFGGAAFVEASREFTYAEYARRGFFELVWVSGLSLSFLLGARGFVRPAMCRGEYGFVMLAVAFIGLLYVIMISALSRMALYTSLYGLTELAVPDSLHGLAGGRLRMVHRDGAARKTEALRNRRPGGRFLTIAALNAIDPDALIVRTNLGRVGAPQPLDTRYLSSLSADAVPALVDGLATLPVEEQERLRILMANRWPATQSDWRTWSWSRSRAATALETMPAASTVTSRQEN